MAVGSQQYSVTSGPAVVLASAPSGPPGTQTAAVVLLPDAANDVYLGGVGVSSSTGVKLAHGTALSPAIPLFAGDVLYAVAASTTATISVLQV